MNLVNACPTCGTVLSSDAPQGLCPKCLLKRALESGVDLEPKGPGQATLAYRGPFIAPTPAELAPLFPQLEIVELLGQGGMGAVYKARQPHLDRMVALKVLPPEANRDPSFAERFIREARALARLSHPNIVAVYDYGQAHGLEANGLDGLCYFIMEYVDGVNLRQVMRTGTLKADEALKIVPQVCDALHYAHEENIVHRDIKPENILLDKKGRVKIADFGLAKLLGTPDHVFTLTSPQQVMGTIHYMAPEQMEQPHHVDHRADIYSLGVVFYEMLTGELPLGRFPLPSQRVQIDVRLDDVVLRTLEKEPGRRYQRASEVKQAVEKIGIEGLKAPRAIPLALPVESREPAAPRGRNIQEEIDQEMSRLAVKAPAAGLYFVAVLFVLAGVVGFAFGVGAAARTRGPGEGGLFALLGVGAMIVGPLLGGIVFYGALQMVRLQNYEWAILASIVALLALASPAFPVGVIGIWALIVLRRTDVRMAFVRRAVGVQARPASYLPPPSGVLPILLERLAGFWEAKGLVRLGDDALLMEADVGVMTSKVRQCRIAFKDIASIVLQRGWTSDAVLLTTSTLSALSDVPGAKGGELKMKVSRDHRPLAERLVAVTLQRIAPMHAEVAPVAAYAPVAPVAYAPGSPEVPPTSPYQPAPPERGPVGRMFHSFAKAAKNLFVETTFETQYTVGESGSVSPPLVVPPADPPIVPSPLVHDDAVRGELVRMQTRPPAIAMMVVAFLHLAFWWLMSIVAFVEFNSRERENVWIPVVFSLSVPLFVVVFLLLAGARSMLRLERCGLANFASYWVRIPWSPFVLLGLPFGLWARSVLKRPDVRAGFARQAALNAAGKRLPSSRSAWALLYGVPVILVLAYTSTMAAIASNTPHEPGFPFYTAGRPESPQNVLHYARAGDHRSLRRILEGFPSSYTREWINQNDKNTGRNTLHDAVQSGQLPAVECVLQYGADPSVREASNFGDTPLLMALGKPQLEVAHLLLEHGADVNGKNFAGLTPLMRAAEGGHVGIVHELLDRNAQVNARTTTGMTALHAAAKKGNLEILRILLERGVDAGTTDESGQTALALTASHRDPSCVNLLLEKGSKRLVNQRDKLAQTPLVIAVWKNNAEVAKLLREAGAADTPIIAFQRAYRLALDKKHAEAIPVLLQLLDPKDGIRHDEGSWKIEVGLAVYEITYPYLLTQLVLAECYQRSGNVAEREQHLQACVKVWPALPAEPQTLPLYKRTIKQGNKETVDTFSLSLVNLKGQAEGKDKLLVKQWVTYSTRTTGPELNYSSGTTLLEGVIY